MQYNGQTNDYFRCRWNNCNDSNRKCSKKIINKQAFLLTSKQLATVVLTVTLKQDLFIKSLLIICERVPLTLFVVIIFEKILLKLAILRGLIIMTLPLVIFLHFYKLPPIYKKYLFLFFQNWFIQQHIFFEREVMFMLFLLSRVHFSYT